MRILAILLALSLACPVASVSAQDVPTASSSAPPPVAPGQSGLRAVVTYALKARKPLAIELVRGIAFFKVQIAGRKVWMMLDNGADHSLIDASLIEPLDIKTRDAPSGRPIRTPTGTLPYRVALDVPLVIPGQLQGKIPMAAVDLKDFSRLLGHPVDAVLGADLLNASIVGLDVGRQRLEILPATAKITMPVQPITLAKGKPQFEMMVGGKPVQVTIDLGFSGELSLSPEAWARVAPPPRCQERGSERRAC